MNNSWFNKCFDGFGVNDGLFDDLVKYLDFPLEDVEGTDDDGASGEGVVKDFHLPLDDVEDKSCVGGGGDDAGEDWDCNFQNLEPPPANVLASLSSGFCGDFFSDTLENKFPVSCDESSELNQLSGITKASSSRSTTTLNGESVDVKGSTWFQTSSPVSVLETSSACSSAKPAPINPKLSFLVKRDRSKRRRASTFNLQFTLPFISSTGSTSLVGSESESESHLTEKSAKKRQKKKNLTWLSGSSENDRSSSEEAAVVRKCTHCEVTKTPQWREGPKGPKTLCNACGVRYRSGRLFPEYRPAASPTFVASLHSNSHKKVIEMRKQCQTAEVGNTIYGVNSTRNSNRIDY
ncbi:hypothetical protein ES319_A08G211000v1 [Gossypium barbadense]|uniref:GATA-type domain-containing protein n=1 Tax=Gossypium barbadense TaxID=3634 RepID=A0A5J5UUX7_GOSBA|nr:hypothetical protein ES319_A08G211000v1 [Gossypium barbadense]KAB2071284.1 hypothetical protein ES319_A08G211000v1 [Gossypium barbadense]